MSKFKVGDWVTLEGTLPGDKFQLTEKEIEHEEILLAHFRFSKDKWSVWHPQVGEWCWYNHGFHLQAPTLVKYSKQDIDKAEPFIGKLPSWIEKQ